MFESYTVQQTAEVEDRIMKAVGGHGKIKIIGRQAPKIDLTDFVAVHNSYNGYMNLWKAIDAKTVFLAEFKKAPCSNF